MFAEVHVKGLVFWILHWWHRDNELFYGFEFGRVGVFVCFLIFKYCKFQSRFSYMKWWSLQLSVYSSWRAGYHALKVKRAKNFHKSEIAQKNFSSEMQFKHCKPLSRSASCAALGNSKQGGTDQGYAKTALAVANIRWERLRSWKEVKKNGKYDCNPRLQESTWLGHEPAGKNHSVGESTPREMVQGSPSPSSKKVHQSEWKMKQMWQEGQRCKVFIHDIYSKPKWIKLWETCCNRPWFD